MTALPPELEMKMRAKEARRETGMSHGRALDLVAQDLGYRDWNAASALAPKATTSPPIKKMRNRVLLQLVVDYRLNDCFITLEEISQRLAREHPVTLYNEDYLKELMSTDVIEMMMLAEFPNKWTLTTDVMKRFYGSLLSPEFRQMPEFRREAQSLVRDIMSSDKFWVHGPTAKG